MSIITVFTIVLLTEPFDLPVIHTSWPNTVIVTLSHLKMKLPLVD